MSRHRLNRRLALVTTLLAATAIFSGLLQPAIADVDADRRLVGLYIASALNNDSRLVRKPPTSDEVRLGISCESSDVEFCKNENIHGIVEGNIWSYGAFTIHVVKAKAEMDLRFAKPEHLQGEQNFILKRYGTGSGYFDTDDLECQLGYALNGNQIFDVTIVISSDAPAGKRNACLSSQFLKANGIALPGYKTFADDWNDAANGLKSLNDKEIFKAKIVRAIKVILQRCGSVKSGMNLSELTAAETTDSVCFRNMKQAVRLKD